MIKKIDLLSIALFLLMAFFLVLSTQQCQRANERSRQVIKTTQKAALMRDELGRSKARLSTISTDRQTIKTLYEKQIDSLKKDFSSRLRNLKSVQQVGLQQDRKIVTRIVYDTTPPPPAITRPATRLEIADIVSPRGTFNFSDRWLTLTGSLLSDKLTLSYQSFDSLSIVQRGKGNDLRVEILSYNPHSTLRGVTSFQVAAPRRSRFGIGLFAGPVLTTRGFSYIGVGGGIVYRFF